MMRNLDTALHNLCNIDHVYMKLSGMNRSAAVNRLLPRWTGFPRANVKSYDFLRKIN